MNPEGLNTFVELFALLPDKSVQAMRSLITFAKFMFFS